MVIIEPAFLRTCPICGGRISASELASGTCHGYKNRMDEVDLSEVTDETTRRILSVYRSLKEFEDLFRKAVGSRMRSVQRIRAKRLLAGMNFSILAPTGMGKSTFVSVAALYYASKGGKVMLVLPTKVLVKQAYKRLLEMSSKANREVRIIAYGITDGKKARKEIEEGNFDILVVTSAFLSFHVDKGINLLNVVREKFKALDLVIVDDVDAVLKGSKNIRRILMLLGLKEEAFDELKKAYESENRWESLENLRERLAEYTVGKLGQLIVSTATGRASSRARELFQLLNFSVGSSREGIRNVIDVYDIAEPLEELKRIAKLLRDGFIVFVPVGQKELIPKVVETLRSLGISADDDEHLEEFIEGKLNALVGTSYYYGRLVRGLDIPERLKFVVFLGVPKFVVTYGEKPKPSSFIALAYALMPGLRGNDFRRIRARLRRALKRIATLVGKKREMLRKALEGEEVEDEYVRRLAEEISSLWQEMIELVRSNAIDLSSSSIVVRHEGDIKLYIPDAKTYIQASGRTSRLYAGGVTLGLSIVIDTDEELINKLIKRTAVFDVNRYKLDGEELIDEIGNKLSLKEVITRIEEERKNLHVQGDFDPVKPVLFIVESPNKARTIARFFGRPGRIRLGPVNAYEVHVGDKLLIITATGGHVYDLVTRSDCDLKRECYGVEIYEDKVVPVYAPIVRCVYKVIRRSYIGQQVNQIKPELCLSAELKEKVSREEFVIVPEELTEEVCRSREVSDFIAGYGYETKLSEVIDKKEVIDALRRLAFEAENVYIATDPDVEGEFIGRSVAMAIKPFSKTIRRAEFHEVTIKAILNALEETKDIDLNRVYAQIIRRIEDRWIGFGLSSKLQEKFAADSEALAEIIVDAIIEALKRSDERSIKKELNKAFNELYSRDIVKDRLEVLLTPGTLYTISMELCARYYSCRRKKGNCIEDLENLRPKLVSSIKRLIDRRISSLSAGRVQTPVLGWIIDRARSRLIAIVIENEEGRERLYVGGYGKPEETKRAEKLLRGKKAMLRIKAVKISEEPIVLQPMPPYTTDALLADAARMLGFSPEKTMKIAQELFELGLITYHRTDSTRVSDVGLRIAKEYISDKFGEDKFKPRVRQPHGENVQGAHECIRPTRPLDEEDLKAAISAGDITLVRELTLDHYRLYDLIFRRFIASQMPEEDGVKIEYEIHVFEGFDDRGLLKTAEVSRPTSSKGWALIRRSSLDRIEGLLEEDWKVKEVRKYYDLAPEDRIVSEMRDRGIGRPSTYAKIVEKIKDKKYAVAVDFGRSKRLKPTKRGERVFKELKDNFEELVSEDRTRELVRKMNLVESGAVSPGELVEELYKELEKVF